MIKITLNEDAGVAVLEPHGKISKDDFTRVGLVIDPYIEKSGMLNGIVLYSKDFPGWDSFGGFLKHIKFIKGHHKKLSRVALVTDSKLINTTEHILKHFVSAEVETFPFDKFEDAKKWASALSAAAL